MLAVGLILSISVILTGCLFYFEGDPSVIILGPGVRNKRRWSREVYAPRTFVTPSDRSVLIITRPRQKTAV
jgi:hypothetical protein